MQETRTDSEFHLVVTGTWNDGVCAMTRIRNLPWSVPATGHFAGGHGAQARHRSQPLRSDRWFSTGTSLGQERDLFFRKGLYLLGKNFILHRHYPIYLSATYSTVTDFAKFLGLSTSVPLASAVW